jgi:hypothetical protein
MYSFELTGVIPADWSVDAESAVSSVPVSASIVLPPTSSPPLEALYVAPLDPGGGTDVGRAGQVDLVQPLERVFPWPVAVTLVDEELRVRQRRDLRVRGAGGRRVVQQVQVLVDLVRPQVIGDDPGRRDLRRLRRSEVGLLQRGLHQPHERLAVGRDRQALHALVGDAVGQFARERAVLRRQALDLPAAGVETGDVGAVLVRHPEAPVGHRDQALGVVPVRVVGQHLALQVLHRLARRVAGVDEARVRVAGCVLQRDRADLDGAALGREAELADRGIERRQWQHVVAVGRRDVGAAVLEPVELVRVTRNGVQRGAEAAAAQRHPAERAERGQVGAVDAC